MPIPTYIDHEDGFRMPKGFPAEGYLTGVKYDVQPEDLFVTSFPKCGTTWMQNIVYLLLHDGKPIDKDQNIFDFFPFLEETGAQHVIDKALVVPSSDVVPVGHRLIKTHLPFGRAPWNEQAKYIYVTRNPKDTCVSYFHHTRGFQGAYDFTEGTMDEYFPIFVKGETDFGDYFDNLRSWFDARDKPNVFFITYEDMKANPGEAVKKIASFISPELGAKVLEDDNRLLKTVVEQSSFGKMRLSLEAWTPGERPKDQTDFLRKGIVGDWKSGLTPEQAQQLDDKLHARFTDEEIAEISPLWSDIH